MKPVMLVLVFLFGVAVMVNGECDTCTSKYQSDIFAAGWDLSKQCQLFTAYVDCTDSAGCSGNAILTAIKKQLSTVCGNCIAGYKIKSDNSGCDICPRGQYQPKPYQKQCLNCPSKHSTKQEGSKLEADCLAYCDPGYEKNPHTGSCEICDRGYFKDNDVDVFSMCTVCSNSSYITAGKGATSESQCTVENCTAGYYLQSDKCKICPKGSYSDTKWSDSCTQCDKDKTTLNEGSTSVTDCISKCKAGEEIVNKSCTPCQRGYYQDNQNKENYMCTLCPVEVITVGTGATSKSDCSIANCTTPGYYRNRFTNQCTKCDRGSYQNEKWMESCIHCSNNYTTKEKGSTSAASCLRNCPSGQELDEVNDRCVDCPVGTYRDSSKTWKCVNCSNGLTTQGTKAVSVNECSVSPCTAGQYFSRTENSCELCPKDTYQPAANSFSCESCPGGYFTNGSGKTSRSDCKGLCEINKPKCSIHATCKNTPNASVCTCNSDYVGNGTVCEYIKSDALPEKIIYIIIGSVSGIVVTSFVFIVIILLLRRQGCLISKIDKKQDETYTHLDNRRREEVSSGTHNEAAYDYLDLYEVANETNLNNSDQESRQNVQPESDTLTEPDHSYDSLQERRDRPYATLQPYEIVEN